MPTWGSKCWRIITFIFAIAIIAYSTYSLYIDYISEYYTWYYHITTLLFGMSLLGLALLVREGFLAFTNYAQYGLHPQIHVNPKSLENKTVSEVNGAEGEI